MTTTATVTIPAGAGAPARAREWAERFRPAMSVRRMDDLRLVVSELVANSVLHAGLAAGDPIDVTGHVARAVVVVSVVDAGPGFELPPPPGAHGAPGGRGLAIVAAVSERLLVDPARGGVTVAVARR